MGKRFCSSIALGLTHIRVFRKKRRYSFDRLCCWRHASSDAQKAFVPSEGWDGKARYFNCRRITFSGRSRFCADRSYPIVRPLFFYDACFKSAFPKMRKQFINGIASPKVWMYISQNVVNFS